MLVIIILAFIFKEIYLFEQKSAALYYQTGKLVTLIMALMKSVTTTTLYRLIE